MSIVVACKLPHGLAITHEGETIELNGANVHHEPLNPLPNGTSAAGDKLSYGFGLTVLNDRQQAVFEAWEKSVTTDAAGGKLRHPFKPMINGAIVTFKNEAEARRETKDLSGMIVTGFEGLDADAELAKAVGQTPGLELEKGK